MFQNERNGTLEDKFCIIIHAYNKDDDFQLSLTLIYTDGVYFCPFNSEPLSVWYMQHDL